MFCSVDAPIKPLYLHSIKWVTENDEVEELRLYDILCNKWEDISDLIGIGVSTKKQIKSMNPGQPRQCIICIMETWIENEEALESTYTCTWKGLCDILKDIKYSTYSKKLKMALYAEISSFRGNISELNLVIAERKHLYIDL